MDNVSTNNAGTERQLAELKAEHSARIAELQAAVQAGEENQTRVDARALPPVAIGLLLTGIPDELAYVPWLAGPLIALGVTSALLALHLTRRDRKLT